MIVVMDACAIIACLRGENGSDVVESALISKKCLIHAFNICEVYKDCLVRGEKPLVADRFISDLTSIGLVILDDLDPSLWKQAATIKARVRKVSYADCFALAITDRLNGTLYSSDHHEFDAISNQYSITFIR